MSYDQLERAQEYRRNNIKSLPENFNFSSKQILEAINNLFEIVELNKKLIDILDSKIKRLENKK
tara:strand:+ start:890 stop:1081 length:192 start_codon:yes stop_codon:yes gene_type:complete